MTDEDILIAKAVDSTVASSLILLLVALDEERTTTLAHVYTLAVEVRTVDRAGTPHRYTVVAQRAAATFLAVGE